MEPPQQLNPSQEEALDLGHHIALTAVAGSGKTTVLVERFVRILERNRFRPAQIVAITFTEEAAAEMKDRIQKAISGRIHNCAPGQNGPRTSWVEALERLPSARITTIHGFCLSLLREYPLPLNLNPGFQVLSPGEQEAMLRSSVRDSILRLSRSASSPLEELLVYMPRSKIEGILLEMVRRRSFFRNPQICTGQEQLAARYRRETASVLTRLAEIDKLEDCLVRLPPRLLLGHDSCSRRCRLQFDLIRRRNEQDNDGFVVELSATLDGRVSPTKHWKASPAYEELKQLWTRLRKLIRDHALSLEEATGGEDRHFERAMRALFASYNFARERYGAAKAECEALDFDDLLEMGRRLVRHPEVCQAIRERYPYFLVDEFQDTNPIQWEILEPLIGPASNFFAVGDAKQSIYRFRDADVSVFGQVRKWIEKQGRCVEMPQNYRSLPGLVRFNNRLFQKLFLGKLAYEAEHQEMEPCREVGGEDGQVDVFLYGDEVETSEPCLAANRIYRLIRSEGYSAGDIALLLRTRTRLKQYEEGLGRLGIPYQTAGGMGFFDRQEVLDLINLFRFLEDPGNDVALIGVLRSPLFSLSDEDLFVISTVEGDDFRSKLGNAARQTGRSARPNWVFADSKLSRWRDAGHSLSLSERLRRALRETGYLSILSSSRQGDQRVANTQKFQDIVRAFEAGGRRGLRELLRFVDSLIRSEVSEAESSASATLGDSVRIFTIHGSKGLQFPVVVMPELGCPLSSGPTDRFCCERFAEDRGSSRTYFAAGIWNPDKNYEELRHPVFKMLKRLDQYRQIAEEKRLLYVGTTRARDRLILLGKKTTELSYSRWLEENGMSQPPANQQLFTEAVVPSVPAPSSKPEDADPGYPPSTPSEAVKKQWTVTEILLFERCPRKFYLSQVELHPQELPNSSILFKRPAVAVGKLVHEILETSPELSGAGIDQLLSQWAKRSSSLLTPEAGRILGNVRQHLLRVGSHPFYERLRRASKRDSERSFSLTVDSLTVQGVMDCLFQESDGRWVVVDFKTDRVTTAEIGQLIRDEGYELQVEIYLWAVAQILQTPQVEAVLFFTHTGDLIRLNFGPGVDSRCREILRRLPDRLTKEVFPLTDQGARCEGCGFLARRLCPGGGPRQRFLW